MWPFIQSSKSNSSSDKERKALTLKQLISGIGDISELSINNAALKFWIAEPVYQGINELSEIYGKSSSKMLRDFLFVHCYGIYFLEWLNEHQIQSLNKNSSTPMFCRKPPPTKSDKKIKAKYFVPELGKNISSIKLWIPEKLKVDLTLLAQNANLTVSNYTREIVTSRLLGHGTLPMRPQMINIQATPEATDWEKGKTTQYKEVSSQDYNDLSGGKIEK